MNTITCMFFDTLASKKLSKTLVRKMKLENVFHPLRASIALRARGWFNSYIFEIFGRSSFYIIFRSNEDLLVFDLIYGFKFFLSNSQKYIEDLM